MLFFLLKQGRKEGQDFSCRESGKGGKDAVLGLTKGENLHILRKVKCLEQEEYRNPASERGRLVRALGGETGRSLGSSFAEGSKQRRFPR